MAPQFDRALYLERDEIGLEPWWRGIFLLVPRRNAARVLRARPILLCMGLFSRFVFGPWGSPPKRRGAASV